jgi:hypothetical protein
MTGPARRFLTVQAYGEGNRNCMTKSGIDYLIEHTAGKFTDYLFAFRQAGDARATGKSSLIKMRPERPGGMMPLGYCIQEAAKVGIRVHGELYVGHWGSYSQMHERPPDSYNLRNSGESGCTAISWLDFSNEGARQMVADIIADFMEFNPGLAGINLDFLRMKNKNHDCDRVTPAHIKATAQAVKDIMPAGTELSAFATTPKNNRWNKRVIKTWLEEGILELAIIGAYYHSVATKMDFIPDEYPGHDEGKLIVGLIFDDWQLDDWKEVGLPYPFNVFDWQRVSLGQIAELDDLDETPTPFPPPEPGPEPPPEPGDELIERFAYAVEHMRMTMDSLKKEADDALAICGMLERSLAELETFDTATDQVAEEP